MGKFRISQKADYMEGHLRYGHREGIVEAETKEEALKLVTEDPDMYLDPVADDYEIEGAEYGDNEFEVERIEEKEK